MGCCHCSAGSDSSRIFPALQSNYCTLIPTRWRWFQWTLLGPEVENSVARGSRDLKGGGLLSCVHFQASFPASEFQHAVCCLSSENCLCPESQVMLSTPLAVSLAFFKSMKRIHSSSSSCCCTAFPIKFLRGNNNASVARFTWNVAELLLSHLCVYVASLFLKISRRPLDTWLIWQANCFVLWAFLSSWNLRQYNQLQSHLFFWPVTCCPNLVITDFITCTVVSPPAFSTSAGIDHL